MTRYTVEYGSTVEEVEAESRKEAAMKANCSALPSNGFHVKELQDGESVAVYDGVTVRISADGVAVYPMKDGLISNSPSVTYEQVDELVLFGGVFRYETRAARIVDVTARVQEFEEGCIVEVADSPGGLVR